MVNAEELNDKVSSMDNRFHNALTKMNTYAISIAIVTGLILIPAKFAFNEHELADVPNKLNNTVSHSFKSPEQCTSITNDPEYCTEAFKNAQDLSRKLLRVSHLYDNEECSNKFARCEHVSIPFGIHPVSAKRPVAEGFHVAKNDPNISEPLFKSSKDEDLYVNFNDKEFTFN